MAYGRGSGGRGFGGSSGGRGSGGRSLGGSYGSRGSASKGLGGARGSTSRNLGSSSYGSRGSTSKGLGGNSSNRGSAGRGFGGASGRPVGHGPRPGMRPPMMMRPRRRGPIFWGGPVHRGNPGCGGNLFFWIIVILLVMWLFF